MLIEVLLRGNFRPFHPRALLWKWESHS